MKTLWAATIALCVLPILAFAQYQDPSISSYNSNPDLNDYDYCQGLKQLEFQIDGHPYKRYSLPELKYLNCLKNQPRLAWIVTRTEWTDADQLEWQGFVRALGLAVEHNNCDTVDTCMLSNANPYRGEADRAAYYYSDCAKFPLFLRAYYSFKKGLPFSYVDGVKPNALTPEQLKDIENDRQAAQIQGGNAPDKLEAALNDIRYSKNGNYPVSRSYIPGDTRVAEFYHSVYEIMDSVSTETYRMSAPQGPVDSDFYSPAINPDSIKPGTVLYNTAGHVAIVYDIRPNGVVMTLNAAPGNTLSTRPFDNDFKRANPNNGAGFKNFRPFQLQRPVSGNWQGTPTIVGGKFVFQKDEQVSDFSMEQYDGTNPAADGQWDEDRFVIDNQDVDWMDFVRMRMSQGQFQLDPIAEFKSNLGDVCKALQDRVGYVNSASANSRAAGPVALLAHPDELPNSIYGADGDWESFSSPGRDLRIRAQVVQVIKDFAKYQKKMQINDAHFAYYGKNLKADLQAAFNDMNTSCQLSYKNSSGQKVLIPSLTDLLQRLPRLSYDPYDCPELRWGASDAGELRTCSMSNEKQAWYAAQQFLRNRLVRNENEVMGWNLQQLQAMNVDNAVHPDMYNVQKALNALPDMVNPNYGHTTPPAALQPNGEEHHYPRALPVILPQGDASQAQAAPVPAAIAAPVSAPAMMMIPVTDVLSPTFVSKSCVGGLCVGDQVVNPHLTSVQGQIVGVDVRGQTLSVKWFFSGEVVTRTPDQVSKIE